MFETYRMLGRDREAELEREARVRRIAAEVRRSRHAIPGGSRTAQAVALAVVVAIISAAVAAGLSAWPSLWSAAASVESVPGSSPELNTTFLDGCPNPVNLGAPVNSAADDFCPSPMARKWFLFVSTRPGGCGGADIYVTRPVGRSGWWQPLNLGCHVNSARQEASPYLFTHEKSGRMLIYFSSDRPGGFGPDGGVPDADIYVSSLTTVGFAPARLVPGLNTDRNDARPNLGPDGLEIVFDSDRAGALGGQDVYSATRANVREPWSEPVNLGPAVNTSAMETRASLSWDGNSLFFGSNRAGGEGSSDVYFSTRPAP